MDTLWGILLWFGSAILGGIIIYFKQNRYLTDIQPVAFLLGGPLTLLVAMFPARYLTSRDLAEGRHPTDEKD